MDSITSSQANLSTMQLTDENRQFLTHIRGLEPQQLLITLLKDVETIRNALLLSRYFSKLSIYAILENSLSKQTHTIIKRLPMVFDHIGIEVFGSLPQYKQIIESFILQESITCQHFHSVQFYDVIKHYDPTLSEIDIMRIFTIKGEIVEIFSCHQHYSMTLARKTQARLPISHLALRLNCHETFNKLANTILNDTHVSIFGDGVYYNADSNCYNIKLITKKEIPILKKHLLEFIYHEKN